MRWLAAAVAFLALLALPASGAPDGGFRPPLLPAVRSAEFVTGPSEFGVVLDVAAPCGYDRSPRAVTVSYRLGGADEPVAVRQAIPPCERGEHRIEVAVPPGLVLDAWVLEEAHRDGSWQPLSRFPEEGTAMVRVDAFDGPRFFGILAGHLALAGVIVLRAGLTDPLRPRNATKTWSRAD